MSSFHPLEQWGSKMQVTRECRACIAHRLFGHEGKCKNLHGHNYVFRLTLHSQFLNSLGMVMDFGDIKEYWDKWINENWDHKTIFYSADPIAKALKKSALTKELFDSCVVLYAWNPTAENMAAFLVNMVKEALWKANKLHNIDMIEVEVEETVGNSAKYSLHTSYNGNEVLKK